MQIFKTQTVSGGKVKQNVVSKALIKREIERRQIEVQ